MQAATVPVPIAVAETGAASNERVEESAVSKPQQDGSDQRPYKFSCSVTYKCAADAEVVQQALSVDPELRPEQVSKELRVEGECLLIDFAGTDPRVLRASVGTFCDLLRLATRTLEAFKPAA